MPLVLVEHVGYRYPRGERALDDISFQVEDGECLGIVGPNGAGKSTLLWHLNGLLPAGGAPRGGSGTGGVTIAGVQVVEPRLAEVRRLVGLVFQNPDDQLFAPTIGEDVAFGPENLGLTPAEVDQRVQAALAVVGLSGWEGAMPHQLSVGQRKRAALAGVLACRPRVIALDEPTANLDPRGRRELIRLLAEGETARIIASHDLELILELCSRVIVLDEGRIWADGPTRQVLSDERLLTAHGLERPASLTWAAVSWPAP